MGLSALANNDDDRPDLDLPDDDWQQTPPAAPLAQRPATPVPPAPSAGWGAVAQVAQTDGLAQLQRDLDRNTSAAPAARQEAWAEAVMTIDALPKDQQKAALAAAAPYGIGANDLEAYQRFVAAEAVADRQADRAISAYYDQQEAIADEITERQAAQFHKAVPAGWGAAAPAASVTSSPATIAAAVPPGWGAANAAGPQAKPVQQSAGPTATNSNPWQRQSQSGSLGPNGFVRQEPQIQAAPSPAPSPQQPQHQATMVNAGAITGAIGLLTGLVRAPFVAASGVAERAAGWRQRRAVEALATAQASTRSVYDAVSSLQNGPLAGATQQLYNLAEASGTGPADLVGKMREIGVGALFRQGTTPNANDYFDFKAVLPQMKDMNIGMEMPITSVASKFHTAFRDNPAHVMALRAALQSYDSAWGAAASAAKAAGMSPEAVAQPFAESSAQLQATLRNIPTPEFDKSFGDNLKNMVEKLVAVMERLFGIRTPSAPAPGM